LPELFFRWGLQETVAIPFFKKEGKTRMQKAALQFFTLAAVMIFAGASFGQQSACRVDLPVGIIGTDGSLLDGLTAQDLSIQVHKKTLPIASVVPDSADRRVLFILDTGRGLAPEVRKAEAMLADHVLSRGRASDSFALMTTRGAVRQVRFAEGRVAVAKALQELKDDPKEKAKAPNVLDTVMEGIGWFGAARPGDAILLMADHLEESSGDVKFQDGHVVDIPANYESSRVRFKTVAEALAVHRIRVFGVQFSGLKLDTSFFDVSNENLTGITLGSGGFMVVDPTHWSGAYELTEARLSSMKQKVFQLYGAVVKMYVVQVNAPTPLRREVWKLELAKDLRHNTRALYPRYFDPCAGD
jgi:hypothetical protein